MTENNFGAQECGYSNRVAAGVLAIVISVLGVRHFLVIDEYAVNLLFWDQWEFYGGLFQDVSWWETFRCQCGPHRQGVGSVASRALAHISNWNSRAESFLVGGVVFTAMLSAVALKLRLFREVSLYDVALPAMFLGPQQWHIFVGVTTPSHGPFPLLLIVGYALAWTTINQIWRYLAVLFLNFLLIHTWYAVFAGIITPVLLGFEWLVLRRNPDQGNPSMCLGAIVLSLASACFFFVDYVFVSGVSDFQFPHPEFWLYPAYIALAYANVFGLKGASAAHIGLGALFVSTVVIVCWCHSRRLVERLSPARNVSVVITVLTAFSIIFCLNLSVGRLSVGLAEAQSSRYVPYLVPGALGAYFGLLALRGGRLKKVGLVALLIGLGLGCSGPQPFEVTALEGLRKAKNQWKTFYLETEDVGEATRRSGLPVHPWPEEIHLKEKLEFMKHHRLNFYSETNDASKVFTGFFQHQQGTTVPIEPRYDRRYRSGASAPIRGDLEE